MNEIDELMKQYRKVLGHQTDIINGDLILYHYQNGLCKIENSKTGEQTGYLQLESTDADYPLVWIETNYRDFLKNLDPLFLGTFKPQKTIKQKSSLQMEGQLWEECERCGREPIYMPLHLCDSCWPK